MPVRIQSWKGLPNHIHCDELVNFSAKHEQILYNLSKYILLNPIVLLRCLTWELLGGQAIGRKLGQLSRLLVELTLQEIHI